MSKIINFKLRHRANLGRLESADVVENGNNLAVNMETDNPWWVKAIYQSQGDGQEGSGLRKSDLVLGEPGGISSHTSKPIASGGNCIRL